MLVPRNLDLSVTLVLPCFLWFRRWVCKLSGSWVVSRERLGLRMRVLRCGRLSQMRILGRVLWCE